MLARDTGEKNRPLKEVRWQGFIATPIEAATPDREEALKRVSLNFAPFNTMSEKIEMAPQFDPRPLEEKWSAFWIENNIGAPRAPQNGEKPFVITIPPPNVTGVLHLGHALQHAIHDCLIRYHRMKGVPTLCVPGTDHAGIATQIKVERQLESQGSSRKELGREAFIERVYDWKNLYGATIIDQMKALGCSYDWDRERFTMDEAYVRAVLTVFKEWFERGLIYRGYRLANWSSGAQTTISDLEIEQKEVAGSLTYIKYPVEDSLDEFVTVATSRPETMLGDLAVAVHPDDARYSHLRGKNVILPLQNRAIPLLFDDAVDKDFGTGAVKITPAHDPNDYEMGARHGLGHITVIGFDDKITTEGGDYAGLDKIVARKKIVADLRASQLIEKVEPLVHNVPHCARTGVVIEPLLSRQWFVAMKELARPVADAIRENRVEYIPPRFAQTSLEWMDNIRDWCISRQLWWGHRIPIWYGPNGETKCSLEPIEGWTQDEDVLDTWFSSALWPFAVLGWPDNLEREFYPTSILITGRDILNLWVSRMILTSLDFVKSDNESEIGSIPFQKVLVHPTIQDVFGRRMSKSLGTGIDPMELIPLYGADATRYGLLQLAGGSQDVRFLDESLAKLGLPFVNRWAKEKPNQTLPLEWTENDGKPTDRFPQMQAARNFANKIWNAARLVLSNAESGSRNAENEQVVLENRWILSRLNHTISQVTNSLDNFEFDRAASALYEFIWGDFCDWFLEVSKPKLRANDAGHIALMAGVLETSMRLLHPFMPFLSEEIWSKTTGKEGVCMASWPVAGERDLEAERDFALVQETVRAIRNLRQSADVAPGKKIAVSLLSKSAALRESEPILIGLANLESVQFLAETDARPQNAMAATLSEVEVILPLEGLIDIEKERAKLEKQLETASKDFEKMSAKLANPKFVEKAPPEVITKDRARVTELETLISKTRERLAAL